MLKRSYVKSINLLLVIFLLCGCSNVVYQKGIKNQRFNLSIIFLNKMPKERVGARAFVVRNKENCKIYLLKEDFPGCLLHELLHCTNGKWHDGIKNYGDYCD